MDLNTYLRDKRETIEKYLESYFEKPVEPEVLHDAMKYSLFAGGKRIRPILCLTAYEACGKDSREILQQAGALELIHTYSLIHDDLPSMDDDDLRRGKPTNHKVFGEAIAILAGDGLLTEAFLMFLKNDKILHNLLIDALKELSSSAGLYGMVAGQAMDIISEGKRVEEDTLRFIHRNKTAALIKASVKIGGILSNTEYIYLRALTEFGENIGHAFQIVDDILDVSGTTEELGKTKGSDTNRQKMTYPALYGLERSREIARTYLNDAKKAIDVFSDRGYWLNKLADYLLERTN